MIHYFGSRPFLPTGFGSSFTPITSGARNQSLLSNTDGDKAAWLIQAPKSGTLDKFEFYSGVNTSMNSSSVVRVSFQAISTSVNISPTETVQQYRDIAGSAISANAWIVPGLMTNDGTDTGTKRNVSQGDFFACVFEWQTRVSTSTLYTTEILSTTIAPGGTAFPVLNQKRSGTWQAGLLASPLIILKYSDGSYELADCSIPVMSTTTGTVSFNSGTNPNQRGVLFQVPLAYVVRRVFAAMSCGGTAAFNFELYDSGNAAVSPFPISVEPHSCANANGIIIVLPTDLILTPNSDYRLVVHPTTGTNISVESDLGFPSAAMQQSFAGPTWKHTQRQGTGAWTDSATSLPFQFGFEVVGIAA